METAPSELLAHVVVGVSFFGLGLALYLGCTNVVTAFETRGHRRALNIAYACARFGFVAMIGLVTEAVYRAGAVRPEWRTWAYVIAGLMVGFGYLGVAIESRRV